MAYCLCEEDLYPPYSSGQTNRSNLQVYVDLQDRHLVWTLRWLESDTSSLVHRATVLPWWMTPVGKPRLKKVPFECLSGHDCAAVNTGGRQSALVVYHRWLIRFLEQKLLPPLSSNVSLRCHHPSNGRGEAQQFLSSPHFIQISNVPDTTQGGWLTSASSQNLRQPLFLLMSGHILASFMHVCRNRSDHKTSSYIFAWSLTSIHVVQMICEIVVSSGYISDFLDTDQMWPQAGWQSITSILEGHAIQIKVIDTTQFVANILSLVLAQ